MTSTPFVPAAKRFFRTPKGLLVACMAVLLAFAAAAEGPSLVAPGLLGAVIAAMIVDAPIIRYREGEWLLPDGAFLTGLIVAMVLSPHQKWWVAAVTSVIAIISKYAFRVRKANVFNPAALALVATFYMFNTGQSWWGALPEAAAWQIIILFATGIFITDRVNKVPTVLAFLGAYYLLATAFAFMGNPAHFAALYREPDLNMVLYFAFFMVTDPPTSPPKQRDQLIFGVVTAVVSFTVYETIGAAYFLLAGLLVANGWEAWRRARARVAQTTAASASAAG